MMAQEPTPAAAIRVVIVEDEAPARRKLKRFVQTHSSWQVIGEADDVEQAVRLMNQQAVDVVLLDIQLKTGTAFDLLNHLPQPAPHIVFITAYDEHAVRAFDINALDYLLKPLEVARFMQMVQRVQTAMAAAAAAGDATACSDRGGAQASGRDTPLPQRLAQLLATLEQQTRYPQRLLVMENERGRFIQLRDLIWIKAARNDLNLKVRDANGREAVFRYRSSLTDFNKRLDPTRFVRVNRSTVVNLDAVREVQTWFKGGRLLVMSDGETIKASRKYWAVMDT